MGGRTIRIWLVGFGTVGRRLAQELLRGRGQIAQMLDADLSVVGLANERDGFVSSEGGFDLAEAIEARESGGSLTELRGATPWGTALEGITATDADVLVETSLSPATDGEPGLAHIRAALERSIPVVTSNKWPVALAGMELAAIARANRTTLRAESTVMSGTPVLGPLTEGLAGARPTAVRAVLNATANFMLGRIAEGAGYDEALAEAKRLGLAEPDPATDVDGHDSTSKLMVLAALVFGRALRAEDVHRRGISALTADEIEGARSGLGRLREVGSLRLLESGELDARLEPMLLADADPLAHIEGTTNAVVCQASPLGEIAISGPGAGPEIAGQGVLSDLLAVGRELARR